MNQAPHQGGAFFQGPELLAVPQPQPPLVGVVAAALLLAQTAALLCFQSGGFAQVAGPGQEFQPLLRTQAAHIGGLEQLPLQQAPAQFLQRWRPLLAPALQVVAGADVVVGEEAGEIELAGSP